MRRREFINLIGGAAAAWPFAASAQQTARMPIIGYLAAASESADLPRRTAFVKRLGELGWVEGKTAHIEYRWANGAVTRAAEMAPELQRLPVDIFVTNGDAYVLAIKRITATIPIVFMATGDPVGNGLVESLARPGGNVTGLSLQLTETVGKRLELLREVVPSLQRLAFAFNADDRQVHLERNGVLTVARSLGLKTIEVELGPDRDLAPAIETLKGQAEALYACLDPFTVTNAARINVLAIAAQLPVIHGVRESVPSGGLMSYGPSFPDMSRRGAEIVDKILRGTKPADIPVEQPTKFDLVVNLKTAKVLNLRVPGQLLALADEVIE